MTERAQPGAQGSTLRNIESGEAANSVHDGFIVPSSDPTLSAQRYAGLDETQFNDFDLSTSGLDVTIDPGEAFVDGWLATDETYTVNLDGFTDNQTVVVGWDADAVYDDSIHSDREDADRVIVELESDLPTLEVPYMPIWEFDADNGSIVNTTDLRKFNPDITVNIFSADEADITQADVTTINSEDTTTDTLNGEYHVRDSDGESEVRALIENADFGDKIVFPPGFSVTISNGTLTMPPGVMLVGTAKPRGDEPATIEKGFDGDLLEYNDFTTIKNVKFDGQGDTYSGDNLTNYNQTGGRESLFEELISVNANGAAMRQRQTYLSTFIGCAFGDSNDGIHIDGTVHSPHNVYLRCNIYRNDRFGVCAEQNIDRTKFLGCLIHANERAGIGTINSEGNATMLSRTEIGGGTLIQSNKGPGILCEGAANGVFVNVTAGSQIFTNNEDPPSDLTSTNGLGDIHIENGQEIRGSICGEVGSIHRYNDNGDVGQMSIIGSVGDIELPSTEVAILNDARVNNVITIGNGVALDPVSGSVVSY